MTAAITISVWLLLQCWPVRQLAAQPRFDRPVFLNNQNGLPVNDVRAIKKGADGFVWIATSDGLCRFDGGQVKRFAHDPVQNSIGSNNVNAVLPLQEELWTGHANGISILDKKTNRFRHIQLCSKEQNTARTDNIVNVLKKDKRGRIWIGARHSGLWCYDPLQDTLYTVSPHDAGPDIEPVLGSQKQILSLEVSRFNDTILWAGTSAGLIEVNTETGSAKLFVYAYPDKQFQVAANAFRRLYHHDDGFLYVGSWRAGVNIFDPLTKSFLPLNVSDHLAKKVLQSAVSTIYRKSEKEIWITCGNGLVLYDTDKKDAVWVKENEQTGEKFFGVDMIDEKERIWHYNINGIQYHDPVVQQFATFSYEHLYGKKWAFSFFISEGNSSDEVVVCPNNTDALYVFYKKQQQWQRWPLWKRTELPAIIRGFAKQRDGSFLLSADDGLYVYDRMKKKLRKLKINPPLRFHRWLEMVVDKDDNVWLAVNNEGLLFWDRKHNRFQHFKKEIFSDPAAPMENARKLFCDRNNNIWFAHNNGFSVFNRKKNGFENFFSTGTTGKKITRVQSFAEDQQNRVWMSTGSGELAFASGLYPEKGVLQKISLQEKNISGYAVQLATDKDGFVWGYTAGQLFRLNTSDFSLKDFSFHYGIDRPDFYHFSFLPSNEIVFGGRTKISLVDPLHLQPNTEKPLPYIDAVEVLGAGQHTPLSIQLPIRLQHNEKNIAIGFSAIAFTLNKEVRFRYRLPGVHDWVAATDRRMVNYTNLAGGDYVFQLQAASNEGEWNETIAELPIRINIPWWASYWFYTGVFILMAAIVYAVFLNRIRSIQKKEKLRTEYEKQLANVEMSALRAQMNPHFLFNSLNSIDSYIIKNDSRKASEYLNSFARLIRLILHNSKSNFISLKDELEALDLYLQMESLRFKNRFEYKIQVGDEINPETVQLPPLLIQPYVENAIWHGIMHRVNGAKGELTISLRKKDNYLYCTVQDNGIGRQKAMELAAHSQGPKKRSMGMHITGERIGMLNRISGRSTTVTVSDLTDDYGNAMGTKVQLVIPLF